MPTLVACAVQVLMNSEAPENGHDAGFAALSRIVLGEEPLGAILERVVRLAKDVLPIECEASITLVSSDGPTTVAFTNETALALDERQNENEHNPHPTAQKTRE